VGLGVEKLEFHPFFTAVSVNPLEIMQNILWHTQEPGNTDVTVMVCLQHYVITPYCVIDDESCLIGKKHVSFGVMRIQNMRTAAIFEVFCFLPVHRVDVFHTVVTVVLDITSFILANKLISIIDMVDDGYRQPTGSSLGIKSFTQFLVDVVTIVCDGLISF